MKHKNFYAFALCGTITGAVNGLFGAGGGMLLVPALTWLTSIDDSEVFAVSVSIIAPICIISLLARESVLNLPWLRACPYLIGSILGGIIAGLLAKRISTTFLHRMLGLLILWGGIRYLC